MKKIANELNIEESVMIHLAAIKGVNNEAIGFSFECPKGCFTYYYENGKLQKANMN